MLEKIAKSIKAIFSPQLPHYTNTIPYDDKCSIFTLSKVKYFKSTVERRLFIDLSLQELKVNYDIQKYTSEVSKFNPTPRPGTNFIVYLNEYDQNKPTLLIDIHYDVLYQNSQNANDNSVAIGIAFNLIRQSLSTPISLDQNVIIVFTDEEETGFHGVTYLYNYLWENLIQISECIVLDMCGIGDTIFIDHRNNKSSLLTHTEFDILRLKIPPQNAIIYTILGIKANCIGLCYKDNPYFSWGGIHSKKDKWCRIDMSKKNKVQSLLEKHLFNLE